MGGDEKRRGATGAPFPWALPDDHFLLYKSRYGALQENHLPAMPE